MKLESLQAVIFSSSTPGYNAASAWSLLTENAFQTFNTNPANPAMTSAAGQISGFGVEVQVQPGRIDIFLRSQELSFPTAQPSALPPLMANIDEVIELSGKLLSKLHVIPLVHRVAIVAQGLEEADSVEAVTQNLLQKIPGLPHQAGGRDISYQINVPAMIGEERTVPVNRLCRWSTSQRAVVIMQVSPHGGQQPMPATGPTAWVAESYVDVYSAESGSPLAQNDIARFITAIGNEVRRILSDGYAALGQ